MHDGVFPGYGKGVDRSCRAEKTGEGGSFADFLAPPRGGGGGTRRIELGGIPRVGGTGPQTLAEEYAAVRSRRVSGRRPIF